MHELMPVAGEEMLQRTEKNKRTDIRSAAHAACRKYEPKAWCCLTVTMEICKQGVSRNCIVRLYTCQLRQMIKFPSTSGLKVNLTPAVESTCVAGEPLAVGASRKLGTCSTAYPIHCALVTVPRNFGVACCTTVVSLRLLTPFL